MHPRTRVGGGAQRKSTADGEAKAVLERMGGAGVEREARNGVPPEGIPSSLIIMPIRVSVALPANSPSRPIIRWCLCLPHISPCRIDIKSATEYTLPVNVARISRKTATFPAALTQNRPLRALRQSTWQAGGRPPPLNG